MTTIIGDHDLGAHGMGHVADVNVVDPTSGHAVIGGGP